MGIESTNQKQGTKRGLAVTKILNLAILFLFLISCSSSPAKPEFGLIGDFNYKASTIRMEHVAIPFRNGDSLIVLEGMLYLEPKLTSYRGMIITHGRNGPRPRRNKNEVFGLYDLNMTLAGRGAAVLYLVRRGYGASEGEDSEFLETPADSGLAAAEDLAAGVEFIKTVSGVRENGIVIMGASQGGWAALAAASLNIKGVILTVNLCGGTNYSSMGLGFITERVQQDWIIGCAELGANARIPSIWIYSENDHNHPPERVKSMFDAYIQAGGEASLYILPAYKDNGHMFVLEPNLYVDYIFRNIVTLESE